MTLNNYLSRLRCPVDEAVESLVRGIVAAMEPSPDDVKAEALNKIVCLVNYAYSHGAKLMKDRVLEAMSWPKKSER